MSNAHDLPTLSCETQGEWEAWLATHHADTHVVWLKFAKKAAGTPSVSYAEAVESALCYGWIDGQSASLDGTHWRQRFTPRRPKSVWSRVNREKAEALIAAGRMQPAGLRQVELAKADGRWDAAYDSQSTIEVPADLQRALDVHPAAKAFFATLDSRNRYAILYRIQTAKKSETRSARIEKFVTMLAQGQKIYP
ncbi:MAG TPA: YdeI/OmpD-associated family protein [Ktedonobacterales bacterium]|nr:YdeI/OmpD-associated family protein [Ktedonobacterales bacterium]